MSSYPEIPEYLSDSIVFEDKHLGIAMIALWNKRQWIFRVLNGQWVSVRETGADDPPFVTPIKEN